MRPTVDPKGDGPGVRARQIGRKTAVALCSTFDLFESVGRQLVDLGGIGSGLLDKIEEHWGKRVSRVLTFLITLAVAASCVAIIWNWLLSPLLTFVNTPLWGHSLLRLVFLVLGIGLGIAFSFSIGLEIEHWRRLRKVNAQSKDLISRAERNVSRTEESLNRARGLAHEFSEDKTKLRRLSRHLIEGVRKMIEKGVYSQEEEAEIDQYLTEVENDLDDLLRNEGNGSDDGEPEAPPPQETPTA